MVAAPATAHTGASPNVLSLLHAQTHTSSYNRGHECRPGQLSKTPSPWGFLWPLEMDLIMIAASLLCMRTCLGQDQALVTAVTCVLKPGLPALPPLPLPQSSVFLMHPNLPFQGLLSAWLRIGELPTHSHRAPQRVKGTDPACWGPWLLLHGVP